MKNKFMLRLLCTTLCASLLLTSVPAVATAETEQSVPPILMQKKQVSVLSELEDQRKIDTKVFLMSDGTNMSVTGMAPLHYEDEKGKLQDINNTLVEKDGVLKNTANSMNVTLPSEFSDTNEVSVSGGNNTLTFTLLDTSKKAKGKKQNKTAKKAETTEEKQIEKIAEFQDDSSSVTYEDVDTDNHTDIKYDVLPSQLKESIILNSIPKKEKNYVYFVKTTLTGTLNKDNSIDFSNDTEKIFTLPAPYMFDSNGIESTDISVSLTKVENGYNLTYNPSKKWLKDKTRKYPVTIDPTVELTSTNGNLTIDQVSIDADNLNNTRLTPSSVRLGANGGTQNRVGAFKLSGLQNLVGTNLITSAVLKTTTSRRGSLTSNMGFYKMKKADGSDFIWTSSNTNSEIVSAIDKTNPIDILYGEQIQTIAYEEVDITKLLGSIYKNTTYCFGVALENKAADYTIMGHQINIILKYKPLDGIRPEMSHSMDMGDAGTAYVNDTTGSLGIIRTDVSLGGERMPVELKGIYTDKKWYSNYHQTFTKQINGTETLYLYKDENMATNYLEKTLQEDGTYKYTNGQYTLVSDETEESGAKIESGDLLYTFDWNGRLVEIKNKTTLDKITVTYHYSDLIDYITDGVGRKYQFEYSSSLSEYTGCTVKSAGGTVIEKVIATGNTSALNVNYYGNSSTIQKTVKYTGHSIYGYMTGAESSSGYKLSFTHITPATPKVSKVVEQAKKTDGTYTNGDEIGVVYNYRKTDFTSASGSKESIIFDNDGNKITTTDENGNSVMHDTAMFGGSGGASPNTNNLNWFNSGLEAGSLDGLINSGTNASVNSDTTQVLSGTKSGKLIYKSGISESYIGVLATKELGRKNHTFSAWIKTQGTAKAYLVLKAGTKTAQTIPVSSPDSWTKQKITLNTEDIGNGTQLVAQVQMQGTSGAVYVDDMQLSPGKAEYQTNYIHNGDFKDIEQNYQNKFVNWPGTDLQEENLAGTTQIHNNLNNKVAKFVGELDKQKSTYQIVSIDGRKGDTISFNAWAKASALPLKTDTVGEDVRHRTFSLIIKDENDNQLSKADFNPATTDWQRLSSSVYLEEPTNKIKVYLSFDYQVGTALFDGIELFRSSEGRPFSQEEPEETEIPEETPLPEPTKTTDSNGNVTEIMQPTSENTGYESVSNKYTQTLSNATTFGTQGIRNKTEYTSDNNYTLRQIDPLGLVTQFGVNTNNGRQDSVTTPNGNKLSYTYDAIGNLTKILQDNGTTSTTDDGFVSYSYTNTTMTITQNGTNYVLTYSDFGDLLSIKVGTVSLISYSYSNDLYRKLNTITFANGNTCTLVYDGYNVVEVKYGSASMFKYEYDDLGNMVSKTDVVAGTVEISDNEKTATYKTSNLVDPIRVIGYDKDGSYDTVNGKTYKTGSDSDGYSTFTVGSITGKTKSDTDKFGRKTVDKTLNDTTEVIKKDYTYNNASGTLSDGKTLTSEQIKSVNTRFGNKSEINEYAYDSNGNITSVKRDNVLVCKYTYDKKGQLTREDNADSNKSTFMVYDNFGNIVTKYYYNKVSFLDDESGFAGYSKISQSYLYDSVWKDKCTSFAGKNNTYDASGNMLTYRDIYSFEWNNLREMSSCTMSGSRFTYTYNESSLRTSKTVNGVTTYYTWNNGNLTSQTNGTDTMYFFYDNSGVCAFELNGAMYYYVKNMQGDVTSIVDSSNACVAQYMYDSWGTAIKVLDGNGIGKGSDLNHIANKNPIRYRGYYYDVETKFYYLQSRYYDPFSARFVNADDANIVAQSVGSLDNVNAFSYCGNSPVMAIDPSGYDCYYFYITEFKNEAEKDQKSLMSYYGYSKDKVHLIEVKNDSNFKTGWNNMGSNGRKIDVVVVNSHANPTTLGNDGKGFSFSNTEVTSLTKKTIRGLILLGCNAGHVNVSNNIAKTFANSYRNRTPVLASDGTVTGRSFFGEYTSKNDDDFKRYRTVNRDNRGWVIYSYNSKSSLTVDNCGKKLSIYQMVNKIASHNGYYGR